MSLAHRSSRSSAIVDAAHDAFSEQGYHGASIADIARRVGVVEGAIYKHFASKRELLTEVIRAFYEPLIRAAAEGAEAIESPRERLRFLVRRQLQAFTDEPGVCRLIISEARPLDDYSRSEIGELSRRYTSLAVAAIEDGIAQGVFRADVPVPVIRDLLYGSTEHLAWRSLTGRGRLDIDTLADQVMALLLGGLAAADPKVATLATEVDRLARIVDRLDPLDPPKFGEESPPTGDNSPNFGSGNGSAGDRAAGKARAS